jgi:phosphatidylserine/phosphatidylglycerophosphate/cardiolipin synthase-like enzyme
MKAVIVDGELLYLGSANWTGAGLGAKGSGRRNFELGIVTDDTELLDRVQAMYERVFRGGECGACKLREECPGPLSEIRTPAREPREPREPAPPAPAPTAPARRRRAQPRRRL